MTIHDDPQLTAKVARLRERAARREAQAARLVAEWEHNRQDIAYVTQPASPHHGFGKQRAKVLARYDNGHQLLAEARELRERADRLERIGIPEKGDAERRRQTVRDRNDAVISVGSKVRDVMFGSGEVVRVYPKSYRIRFRSGSTFSRDKSYITPVE